MMLTEEHRMVRQAIREIAQKEIEPRAVEIDRSGKFPYEILEILKEQGVHLIPLPEEYGGYGSVLMSCIAVEELSKACATMGLWLLVQGSVVRCLTATKNEKTGDKFLRRMADGEIGAFVLTEPDAGSDVASMKTTAVLDGDEYVLNGTKCFISCGGAADFYVTFAKTKPEAGLDGISAFVVERDSPGVSIGRIDEKMGLHGSASAEIVFRDARVPKEHLLAGDGGEGIQLAFAAINPTRVYVAAAALGVAEAALEYATRYAKERVQFGRPIAEFQGVRFLLAEIAMRIEASRSLLYRVAAMIDENKEGVPGFAALAKCFVTEKSLEAVNYAMDILGGHGYMKDHPLERMLRDVKAFHFTEGTNYIQRLHVARAVLKGTLKD